MIYWAQLNFVSRQRGYAPTLAMARFRHPLQRDYSILPSLLSRAVARFFAARGSRMQQDKQPTYDEINAYRFDPTLPKPRSVEETRRHFGISERTVYNAAERGKKPSAPAPAPAPAPTHDPLNDPRFPDLIPSDTIADDNTYWRCPFFCELLPIVPGTKRLDWLAERKHLHERATTPLLIPAVEPAPCTLQPAVAPAVEPAPCTLQPAVAPAVEPAPCTLQAVSYATVTTLQDRVVVRTNRGLIWIVLPYVRDNIHWLLGVIIGLFLIACTF